MSEPTSSSAAAGEAVTCKEKLLRTDVTDCFECKVTGSLGAFAIGAFVLYNAGKGRNADSKLMRVVLRSFAGGCFYISAARVLYLPPFDYLKEKGL
uniref:DUF4536 domain-containing protein n=1 Tax=Panagrellus redivivus TaxID=6233 RepID=A0A7E4V188_PANRE